jgi:hypothetical protein
MAFFLTLATGSGFIGRKERVSELVTELSSKNMIGFSLRDSQDREDEHSDGGREAAERQARHPRGLPFGLEGLICLCASLIL